jgi:hypothetical protein
MRRKPTTIASIGLAFALMLSVTSLLNIGPHSNGAALLSGLLGFLPNVATSNASARPRSLILQKT